MFSNRRNRVFVTLFALGGLIAATAAGSDDPRPAGSDVMSESEMATEDAEGYADDYGISLSVAKDRLSYQASIGEAIADLRSGESDTFGGAWVEHSPTWQVVVRTTSGGPTAATIAEYFSGIPIQVTVRRDAPWSEQETRTNALAIASALDAVVDEHLVLYDPREPKGLIVTVQVPAGMSGATTEELAALLPAVATDKSESVAWHEGPLLQKYDAYGGAKMVNSDDDVACTTGFAVESGGGDEGFVSAGHCDNDLVYEAPDGSQHDTEHEEDYLGDYGDFGWYTVDEPMDNRIYTANQTLRPITSYKDDYGDLYIGQRLCNYGRISGRHCDEIHALCVPDYPLSVVVMEDHETDLGDSGGPWYYGSAAYGIHGGGAWYGGKWHDYWHSLDYLEDRLDVTVMTS